MKVDTGNSSAYTNAAYSSKGMSGLVSGIDTESVVQSMLSGVQAKIDKQSQRQQILEWKQEAYRTVIKDVNDFSNKYFSLTSDSSIRLASLYGSAKAESSSKAVTVTPGSDVVAGSFNMQVARLASNTSVTSGSASGNTKIATTSGKADAFEYSRSVDITIGDAEAFSVDLKDVSDIDEAISKINTAYTAAGHTGSIAAKNQSVAVKDSDGKALKTKFYNGTEEYNGNVKVSLVTTYKDAEDRVITCTDGKYTNADGTEYTGDTSALTLHEDTKAVYTAEDGADLTAKYYKSDDSEYTGDVKVSGSVKTELLFSTQGEFKISGSTAGMAILGMSGTVTAKEDQEHAGRYKASSTGFNAAFAEVGKASGSVDITLDGVKKSFTISEETNDKESGMEQLKAQVQKAFGTSVQFKNSDGKWEISVAGSGRQLSISANADTMEAIGFAKGTTTVSTRISRTDAVSKLGLNEEADTDEDGNYSFKINGNEIKYSAEDSINTIINKVNSSGAGVKMSYDSLADKFKVEASSTGEGFDVDITEDYAGLFSKLGFTVTDGTLDSSTVKKGENAVVNINGVTVERASNDFKYNGMTITLNSTTGKYETDGDGNFIHNSDGTIRTADGLADTKAEISTTRNVDKIVDTLKSFVEDYNKLIEDLNKKTHEKAEYKKYPPLTEAQKKEMSDKEIELWEEKSKTGLMHSDKDIESFLTDMRSAMYTKGDSKYILSSIGINSSANWQDFGKLSVDEDTLRDVLTNHADEAARLFTGTNGLATRLKKACDDCANTSSASPGSLVRIAGVEGKGTEKDNEIYDELEAIKEKLSKLNKTYETRKTRYWDTFNKMEEAISKMNSQQDQLYNYFG